MKLSLHCPVLYRKAVWADRSIAHTAALVDQPGIRILAQTLESGKVKTFTMSTSGNSFQYSPSVSFSTAGPGDDAWINQFDGIGLASDASRDNSPLYPISWMYNWREPTEELRRSRARNVLLIDRMLRSHQPHDVLTQVPENNNWHTKTISVALKIERLMFTTATSRENYEDEATLRSRVQLLSRQLVRMRKRKNVVASRDGVVCV